MSNHSSKLSLLLLNLTLVNVQVFIFDILTFETLDTDFKRFNPDQCVSLKKHFHTSSNIGADRAFFLGCARLREAARGCVRLREVA